MVVNLADVLAESADRAPANVALIDGDRSTTYAGLDDNVTKVARSLVAKGLRPGDRVALLLGNSYEFVVSLFGILRAGGTAVPLNTSLASSEVVTALQHVTPRLLIHDSRLVDLSEQTMPCRTVIVGSRDWQGLTEYGSETPLPTVDPESNAMLLFTSGTEGAPRAAMLSHRALLTNLRDLASLDNPPAVTPQDRTLAVLPLFHVYSLNAVLSLGLAAGSTIVLCDRFDPSETLGLIRRHKVSVVAGAPPMYVAWSAENHLREALADTRLMLSGAAPLAPALFDQFLTVTGKPIWEGYGLTECSPVVATALVSGKPKAGSVGQALPSVEIKIVPERPDQPGMTIDGLDDADEQEPGEVWVRGDSLFSGYWPDGQDGPDEQGWFGTGDVGYLDAQGDLSLVDRRSDLILVSGFNVYPREVERVLESHPGVLECAVIGVEHPYSGEAVKAFIVQAEGAELQTQDLIDFCQTQLARFKCPTIVTYVDSLPHGATGKVAKGQLRS